jgi:hypothetical protein
MADYRTSNRDGLQSYADQIRAGRADGDAFSAFVDEEARKLRRKPDFDDDVRIVYDELMSVLLAKHRDYGPRNIADAPGGPLNGLRVRIHDKVARINNLIDNNSKPQYESLEDSFKDLANYAIIALLVLRDKWDK